MTLKSTISLVHELADDLIGQVIQMSNATMAQMEIRCPLSS